MGSGQNLLTNWLAVGGQRAASRITPVVVSFTATKMTEKRGGTEENSSSEVRNCLSFPRPHTHHQVWNWEEQSKNMWASDYSSTSHPIQSVRVTHLAYTWGVGVGKERILNQLVYWSLKASRLCLRNWNVIIRLKVASKVMKLDQHVVVHEDATQWKEGYLEHSWKQEQERRLFYVYFPSFSAYSENEVPKGTQEWVQKLLRSLTGWRQRTDVNNMAAADHLHKCILVSSRDSKAKLEKKSQIGEKSQIGMGKKEHRKWGDKG